MFCSVNVSPYEESIQMKSLLCFMDSESESEVEVELDNTHFSRPSTLVQI
jgi:hypothetical protein